MQRTLGCIAVILTVTLAFPAARADQGITSPTHRANIGKIVFSTAEIPFRKENPKRFASQFKATDTLYGRVYLARAINNTTLHLGGKTLKASQGRYEIKVFVDGQNKAMKFDAFRHRRLGDKAARTWTSWRFEPHPHKSYKHADAINTTRWAKIINRLKPGAHTLRVEIHVVEAQFRSKGPVAAGEITIVKKKGDRLGGGGSFPADVSGHSNKAGLKKAIRKALLASRTAKKAADIKAIALTSPWNEGRYRDTRQKYRKMTAAVLWADTDNDGFCRFVQYHFVKDAKGKSWGPVRFRAFCNGCKEGDVVCK